jgi:hypothetical protein
LPQPRKTPDRAGPGWGQDTGSRRYRESCSGKWLPNRRPNITIASIRDEQPLKRLFSTEPVGLLHLRRLPPSNTSERRGHHRRQILRSLRRGCVICDIVTLHPEINTTVHNQDGFPSPFCKLVLVSTRRTKSSRFNDSNLQGESPGPVGVMFPSPMNSPWMPALPRQSSKGTHP